MDLWDDFTGLCSKGANAAMAGLTRVFGSRNERLLQEMAPTVVQVCALESEMVKLTDAQLRAKTEVFRERYQEAIREPQKQAEDYSDRDEARKFLHRESQRILDGMLVERTPSS